MYIVKSLVLGSMLAFVVPLAHSAQSGDASIGTWKLNLSKSTFGSGVPPRAETRIYVAVPEGIHLVIDSEAADGTSTKTDVTIRYDGKAHPAAGNPNWDSAATTRVGPNEANADLYRNGEVVGKLRRLVADDGKSMTINIVITKPNGTTETALSVFDRQ
jgi:hypothetical protein